MLCMHCNAVMTRPMTDERGSGSGSGSDDGRLPLTRRTSYKTSPRRSFDAIFVILSIGLPQQDERASATTHSIAPPKMLCIARLPVYSLLPSKSYNCPPPTHSLALTTNI